MKTYPLNSPYAFWVWLQIVFFLTPAPSFFFLYIVYVEQKQLNEELKYSYSLKSSIKLSEFEDAW